MHSRICLVHPYRCTQLEVDETHDEMPESSGQIAAVRGVRPSNHEKRIRRYAPSLFDLDYTTIRSINTALRDEVGLKQGVVLDYACGEAPLQGMFEVTRWIRADVSSNESEKDVVIDERSGSTGLEPESVDLVICTYGLEHIPDPRKAIDEFCRVLKKDGILFISIPFINRLHEDPVDFLRFTSYYWDQALGRHFRLKKKKVGNRWLVLVALWYESRIDELRCAAPGLVSRLLRRLFRFSLLPVLNLTLFKVDADKTPSVYYHEIVIGSKI